MDGEGEVGKGVLGGICGGCRLCLPSVRFVAAILYLSVFLFGIRGLMLI